jgi:alpha-L-fucosidase
MHMPSVSCNNNSCKAHNMNMVKMLLLCGVLTILFPAGILYGQTTAPAPYGPLPNKAQLEWHETDLYAMVCFGLNTYTDKEWGYGDVNPALFNPTAFDASQITGTLKAAGFKGILLVAKHHDGFCLWPTKTTPYSIAASPWMGGKGDLVKSFEVAARKSGLRFGIYNSPWDRNNAAYGTAAYVKLYQQQLQELHQQYGPLFISWYDGANGGDGFYGGAKDSRQIDRSSYYQWNETWNIVRRLQPTAAIFSDIGPDVRWVGNEKGFAAETSWATFSPRSENGQGKASPGDSRWQEAPGGTRNGQYWIPAECDVPLRPGWFYHATQDQQVKSPYELFDLYFKSVGRGAALDLGIAPDQRGILNENDVAALKGFGQLLRTTFSGNLMQKATVKASNLRGGNAKKFSPRHLIDGNKNTYWATDDSITTPEFTVQLHGIKKFNVIRLREYLPLGQRVEAFAIDVDEQGKWQEMAQGTSIGAQRLIRLPFFVRSSQVRVRILRSPVCPVISEFAVFAEPDSLQFVSAGAPKNVKTVSSKEWKIVAAPGSKEAAATLLNGEGHLWQGPFNKNNLSENAIVMDLGKEQSITGFFFTPPAEAFGKGITDRYLFYTSTDGTTWKESAAGEFGNIRANPVKQLVNLPRKTAARFIKFVPQHLTNEGEVFRIAAIGIY